MTDEIFWIGFAQLSAAGAIVAAIGFFMLYRHEREKAAEAAERTPSAE